jgi:hypothetical protein
LSRFLDMGLPMIPSPTNAILATIEIPFGLYDMIPGRVVRHPLECGVPLAP